MSEFKIGWVDAIAKGVLSKDEKTRSEALGLEPRRCFRIDWKRRAESAARGGRLGGGSRRGKSRSRTEGEL